MMFSGFSGSFPGAGGPPPPGDFTGGAAARGSITPITAPAGPQPATAASETGRGGPAALGELTAAPSTLGELLHFFDPPPGFEELLGALGADAEVPVDVFLAVPEADFVEALGALTVDGARVTSIGKARVIVLLRSLFAACGRTPPALGSAPAAALAAPAPTPTAGPRQPPGSGAPPIDAPGATVNLSQTVDQSVKGVTRRLTLTELRDCRVHFETVTGAPPPERTLPTSDQLAGLRAILEQDLPPFVDFAVWSPLGPRAAKFQKTEASVLIGGAFVTKILDAPSSFPAWEDSWALFANAMISLNAARPGTLNAYLDGVKTLLRHFPGKWGSIVATDLLVRSERWLRIREDLERAPYPLGYDPRSPWDFVIGASAYGRDGPLSRWWQDEVVLPMSLGSGRPPLHEGLPGQSTSSSSRGPPPPQRSGPSQRVRAGKTNKQTEKQREQVSAQLCNSYNSGTGPCAAGGATCKHGRRHVCAVCRESHQAYKVHPDTYVPPENKGKGGSGKGEKKKH